MKNNLDSKGLLRCENHGNNNISNDLGGFYDLVNLIATLPNTMSPPSPENTFYEYTYLYDIYYPNDAAPVASYDEFEKSAKLKDTLNELRMNAPTLRIQNSKTGEIHHHVSMREFVIMLITNPPTTFKYFFAPVGARIPYIACLLPVETLHTMYKGGCHVTTLRFTSGGITIENNAGGVPFSSTIVPSNKLKHYVCTKTFEFDIEQVILDGFYNALPTDKKEIQSHYLYFTLKSEKFTMDYKYINS